MARRRRQEPGWPLLIVAGVVVGGLALGAFFTGGAGSDAPARTLAPQAAGDPGAQEEGLPTPANRIRVEVLNGGGIQGAAAEAKDLLRDLGFDVVYYGNASSFGRDTSVVLDRTDLEGAALAVSRSLGAGEPRDEPDADRLVDVTVVLGTDWTPEGVIGTEPIGGAGPIGVEHRPWWDVRRIIGGAR